jgi:Domain of unknown function (DUF4388)
MYPRGPGANMSEPSRIHEAIRACSEALFTGVLRIWARQADGEVWFLSGIVERVRFGVSHGEDATARLFQAVVSRFEAAPCLPNPAGGFKKGHPSEGALGEIRPVDLLRFCETHALTCRVELESGGEKGEFVYRLGELVSVRCDPGTDRAVAKMLDWSVGRFRFELPRVRLPALPSDERPRSIRPEPEEAPATTDADAAARRAAADEARKRRAEEVEVKRRAEDQRTPPPPPESKTKRRPAERAPNRAQRRAELKRRAETEGAPGRSVVVRLRRVTIEVASVSVPVTPALLKGDGVEGGSPHLDPEALFAEAARLSERPGTRWQTEGEPHVEAHPQQPPLFESLDLVRRG